MSEYSTAYGLLQFTGVTSIIADINDLMADKIYNIVNVVDAERPLKKGEYWFTNNGCENNKPFETHLSTLPIKLMDNPSLAGAMERLEFYIDFIYFEKRHNSSLLCIGKVGLLHKKGDAITDTQALRISPKYFKYDVYSYYQAERYYAELTEKELMPDDINAFKDWLDACNPCIDNYLQQEDAWLMVYDCLPTLKSARVPFVKGYILVLVNFLAEHCKYTRNEILSLVTALEEARI